MGREGAGRACEDKREVLSKERLQEPKQTELVVCLGGGRERSVLNIYRNCHEPVGAARGPVNEVLEHSPLHIELVVLAEIRQLEHLLIH